MTLGSMLLRVTVLTYSHAPPSNISQTISFEFACEACDMVCSNCEFDFNVSSCTEELDHTTSAGGDTTLEELEIDSGYWRYNTGSEAVLACYNKNACAGGISGEAGFCHSGYEGPCEEYMH